MIILSDNMGVNIQYQVELGVRNQHFSEHDSIIWITYFDLNDLVGGKYEAIVNRF